MKAKLVFDFNLPEEQEDFYIQSTARNMQRTLYTVSQKIREKIKYSELTEDEDRCWREISEIFWKALEEESVEL